MIEEYGKTRSRSRKVVRVILVLGITVMTFLLMLKIIPEISSGIFFPIKKVEILGLNCITSEEVLRIIDLDTQTSLLLLNKRKMEELLQQDLRIKNVELLKIYPDRLKIFIQEKEVALPIRVGAGLFWVSSDGVVLGPADKVENNTPFITLSNNSDDIKNGERIESVLIRDLIRTLYMVGQKYTAFYKLMDNVVLDDEGIHVYFQNSLKPEMVAYLGFEATMDKFDRLRALVAVLQKTWEKRENSNSTIQLDLSFSYAVVNEME